MVGSLFPFWKFTNQFSITGQINQENFVHKALPLALNGTGMFNLFLAPQWCIRKSHLQNTTWTNFSSGMRWKKEHGNEVAEDTEETELSNFRKLSSQMLIMGVKLGEPTGIFPIFVTEKFSQNVSEEMSRTYQFPVFGSCGKSYRF